MLGIPNEDTTIESKDKVNKYNYIIVASSIMKEPSSFILYHFTIVSIHPERCITLYVINHILLPRKSNFSLITQHDMETIWLIENKDKINWAQQGTNYMLEIKKEYSCLPYGNLATKIMEEIRYNFGDE